jgi:hypothetical protein
VRTDMDETAREIADALKVLRETLEAAGLLSECADYALCSVETYCAVSLRVLKKTNPSKIRDCARTVEIKARMDGIEIVRAAA